MTRKEADPPTEGISSDEYLGFGGGTEVTVAIMNFWEAERHVLTLQKKFQDERAKAQAISHAAGFNEVVRKKVTPARDKFWAAQEASTIAGRRVLAALRDVNPRIPPAVTPE